jgi:hypothetical protein
MVESRDVTVSVSLSFTKNIGNYESLRIEAGMSVPVQPVDNHLNIYANLYGLIEQAIVNESKGLAERLRQEGRQV